MLNEILLVCVLQEYEEPQFPPDGLLQEQIKTFELVKEIEIVPRFTVLGRLAHSELVEIASKMEQTF